MNGGRESAKASGLWRFHAAAFLSLLVIVQHPSPASAKAPGWVEVRSPHFVVVSNSSVGRARSAALQLEQFRYLLTNAFPEIEEAGSVPLNILAVDGEQAMKRLLPWYWETKGAVHPAVDFLHTPGGDYVVLRTDTERPDVFEPAFWGYAYFAINRSTPGLPLWLIHGLASYYSGTRIMTRHALLGTPNAGYLSLLRSAPLLPINTLLAIDRKSPYFTRKNKVSIFYAESWALASYLLITDVDQQTNHLAQFTQLVSNGADQDEAFERAFGPEESVGQKLEVYVRQSSFRVIKVPLPNRITSNDYAIRPVSPAEADAVQADFLLASGRSQEAIAFVQEALKADPRIAAANAVSSSLLLRQGKRAEAEEYAAKAIKLDPNDYRGYIDEATAMWTARSDPTVSNQIEQDLQRAISLRAGLPAPEWMLSSLYLTRSGKLDQALALASDAARNEPDNAGYLTNLEVILLKANRLADAVRVELQILALARTGKEEATLRNDLGWSLMQEHVAPVRAEYEIRTAARLDPQNANIIDSLGYLLRFKGDLAGAADAYRRALSLDPKLISSLVGLGNVLRTQHDANDAAAEYRKAIELAPRDAAAHYGLALSLREKGDTAGAAKELQAARSLEPFNPTYR